MIGYFLFIKYCIIGWVVLSGVVLINAKANIVHLGNIFVLFGPADCRSPQSNTSDTI